MRAGPFLDSSFSRVRGGRARLYRLLSHLSIPRSLFFHHQLRLPPFSLDWANISLHFRLSSLSSPPLYGPGVPFLFRHTPKKRREGKPGFDFLLSPSVSLDFPTFLICYRYACTFEVSLCLALPLAAAAAAAANFSGKCITQNRAAPLQLNLSRKKVLALDESDFSFPPNEYCICSLPGWGWGVKEGPKGTFFRAFQNFSLGFSSEDRGSLQNNGFSQENNTLTALQNYLYLGSI